MYTMLCYKTTTLKSALNVPRDIIEMNHLPNNYVTSGLPYMHVYIDYVCHLQLV